MGLKTLCETNDDSRDVFDSEARNHSIGIYILPIRYNPHRRERKEIFFLFGELLRQNSLNWHFSQILTRKRLCITFPIARETGPTALPVLASDRDTRMVRFHSHHVDENLFRWDL